MTVTPTTAKNLVLDAGVVYLNYGEAGERVLGATAGGNTFLIEREIREIAVDGAKGKVKGLRRLITENAALTVRLKEMSADNIRAALAGTAKTDHPDTPGKTHDAVQPTGDVDETEYFTNVALVATVSGTTTPCVVVLNNALGDGNLEVNLLDKEEMVIEVTFSAHYDPNDLASPIYAIRYPVVV